MATETVKKTKTTAKAKGSAKETDGAVKAVPAVAAKKSVKTAAKAKTVEVAVTNVPTHAEIAHLAERYWAERGWQDGFAEQDWLRAEQVLLGATS